MPGASVWNAERAKAIIAEHAGLRPGNTFSEALRVAREAGYLGPDIQGSGHAFELELRMGAGAYFCG